MQKNKPSYPLLPTPISGGLIYPFPMDTAALGLSVLISGALARFYQGSQLSWSSCTSRREPPGLYRALPPFLPLFPSPVGQGLQITGCGVVGRAAAHLSRQDCRCQHIVPTATPALPLWIWRSEGPGLWDVPRVKCGITSRAATSRDWEI